MHTHRDLEILFPTNYSDSCYRTIPAVAQLAAGLRVRITLLHAYDPRRAARRAAEEQLHSFFAEAAHYCDCRRVAAEGPAPGAIESYAARNPIDLLMMPESDRIGLPRIGHKSLRARLLQSISAPLWTLGAKVPPRPFARTIRNIACRMVYDSPNLAHLRMASRLAERLGANLHLIDIVPPVDEGTLSTALYSSRPLNPQNAVSRIGELTAFMKHAPQVHIATGSEPSELCKVLERCEADLVFAGPGHALRPSLWNTGLRKSIDSCGFPVIALDGAALDHPGWNFGPSKSAPPAVASLRTSSLDRGSQLREA